MSGQKSLGSILVVDEGLPSPKSAIRALRSGGYDVHTVASAPQARSRLAERPWDLVLAPLGSNLDELIERQAPPLLLLGSGVSIDAVGSALAAGARGVLVSPVTPATLLAAARIATRRGSAESDLDLNRLLPYFPPRIEFRCLDGGRFWELPAESPPSPDVVRRCYRVLPPSGEGWTCVVEISPPTRAVVRDLVDGDPPDPVWSGLCRKSLSDYLLSGGPPLESLRITSLTRGHMLLLQGVGMPGGRAWAQRAAASVVPRRAGCYLDPTPTAQPENGS